LIAVGALIKNPGDDLEGEQVELVISEQSDPAEMGAYEELLFDAMQGNSVRFARQDYVEEAWRIVDQVLDPALPLYEYQPKSWGPAEADQITAGIGGWYSPPAGA